MLRNYFKIAWRNLFRSKVYSAVNIVGLATGMAVALLIGLWIWDELTYNNWHKNHASIAQMLVTQTFNGETGTGVINAIPTGEEIRSKYADDFKHLTYTSFNNTRVLSAGETKLVEAGMWVQPDFPEMLTFTMLTGRANALQDPNAILLSRSLATSLFGTADPMNKLVKIDNKLAVKVAGVYEDLPHNTTFTDTKFLLAWDQYALFEPWVGYAKKEWDNHGFLLFAQLKNHVDINKINAKIRDIAKPHITSGNDELQLHPMDRWHLYREFKNGKEVGGRIQFVWLFGTIGVFVLLLACINFMNLSTARSEKRSKEVGIRKAVGALRGQLIRQLLSESLLMAGLSFVLAMVFLQMALPFFNMLADKKMSIPWTAPLFWLLTLGFTFFTGIISGSYPAFYLSGFKPVKVLKGTFRAGRFATLPRKVLVVVQFTVSVTLIIGTLIVYRQIQYAKQRPVGYTREGLISTEMNTPEIMGHYNTFRADLLATGAVAEMGESSSNATGIENTNTGFNWDGMESGATPSFGTVSVSHDFGKTIGWQLKEGRDFSRSYATDSTGMILNEAAVKLIGIKDPIGKVITWNSRKYAVIGIIKNMVMESPYFAAYPTVFYMNYKMMYYINIRINPTMPVREALAKIEPVFRKYDPGSPFVYKFTDTEYARKFADEERIGRLAACFAVLAIFISCLGLSGLASFVAEQRTREIGVRKVLGASLFSLWKLLSKDFVLLVMISCMIATPIAWHFLDKWLQRYEYRAPVSWWIFAIAGLSALVITLITVSYQAIRAASMNPVKSLNTN
jgi:putative ABC transport system permease protein